MRQLLSGCENNTLAGAACHLSRVGGACSCRTRIAALPSGWRSHGDGEILNRTPAQHDALLFEEVNGALNHVANYGGVSVRESRVAGTCIYRAGVSNLTDDAAAV